MAYKPGTLVTLKDGKRYRTSKKFLSPSFDSCDNCLAYYKSIGLNTPCEEIGEKTAFETFDVLDGAEMCTHLFGHSFPKLILPK